MMKSFVFASALVLGLAQSALAAPQTVTLAVSGMTCAACPITVKKALEKVPGVSKVSVSFEKKEAVVTYDDAKTSVKALENATFEAGYESRARVVQAK